jgi:hypothetical protein
MMTPVDAGWGVWVGPIILVWIVLDRMSAQI